jgi:hypothetical protein
MLALIALIIFIILMISWIGGGWFVPADRTGLRYGVGTLVPWFCVLILALFVFGAFGPIGTVFQTTTVEQRR